MLLVVSLTLLVAVTLAQQPHPCRSPEQFEGRLSTFDPDRRFYRTARFAYDDRQRRFREFEEVQVGRDVDFFDKLYLFNEGKEYRVNLRTRTCNETGITRPWIPFGVPPDARFRGNADIGAAGVPDEHVIVNLFDGTIDNNPYFMTASGTDCIPIQAGFFSNDTGGVLTDFFDISIGISDPEAFIPPRECSS
ncbi:LOW QUALITY PROTEIN: mammalian ependymin-related protein 1-like [Haliotis rubra]|uniref:LOW QUALITY PROTEIN: mammalian ependymin-related protein 1-like n=1 Tax=Haliotis rubra TaxID=36100 RepID=UPI001EE5FE25|nr:LOW QUALITY PROTEIN: mammalian ependymin-related protein 1-like [Haliotis rubra]